MEKFIPYEKLSKKEKRKLDQARRQTWGNLNPVTRKPENSKAYNRNKARNWKREISRDPVPGLFISFFDCLIHYTQPFFRCTSSFPFGRTQCDHGRVNQCFN